MPGLWRCVETCPNGALAIRRLRGYNVQRRLSLIAGLTDEAYLKMISPPLEHGQLSFWVY